MPRIILASASPRRRALLEMLNLPFSVRPVEVAEQARPGEDGRALATRLAREKVRAVLIGEGELALAADTVVVLDGTIFPKPADAEEATAMLRRLRGRGHVVYTAVAVGDARGLLVEGGARTDVWLRALSDDDVAVYVASGDPLDKAGAYAVQSRDFPVVERLEGCYANVVGLPLCVVGDLLAAFGVETKARTMCLGVLGHDVLAPREQGMATS